jgi:hypothetical protein
MSLSVTFQKRAVGKLGSHNGRSRKDEGNSIGMGDVKMDVPTAGSEQKLV